MLGTALAMGLGLLAPSLLPSVAQQQATTPIRYVVRGSERLADIASRYGVDAAVLRAAHPGKLSRGTILELDATLLPVPVQKLRVTSRERDGWESIAKRYGVSAAQIRTWNPKPGRRTRPRTGTPLTLWIPSGVQRYPLPEDTSVFPVVAKSAQGQSLGRPNRGRIENAAKLPAGPYTIRFEWQSFGSALAVWNIERVLRGFRAETGFGRELFVGAMSRRSGRRLSPHRSHQSGRDVDIRLPAMQHAEGFKLERDEIDWHATWALVDAFVRTGDVQMIFLERKLRRRLRNAGMAMGADDARLAQVLGVVRHSKGHTAHIHVRFECGPDEERCKD